MVRRFWMIPALFFLSALAAAARAEIQLPQEYSTPGRVNGAQFSVRYPAGWRLARSSGPGVLTEIQGQHQGQAYLLSVQSVPIPPHVPMEGICEKDQYRNIMRAQGAALGGPSRDAVLGGRFSVIGTGKAGDSNVSLELQAAMVCPNINLKCGVLVPAPGIPNLDTELCSAFFSSIRFVE